MMPNTSSIKLIDSDFGGKRRLVPALLKALD